MMQATKPRHGNDPATCIASLFCLTTGRRTLRQRKMSPVIVIVTDVLVHQAFQMALIQNYHMVEVCLAKMPSG
jgi:hypothetical protein